MHPTLSLCPIHLKGGAGHDNFLPLCILMALVNRVLKIVDKGDCEGRNGPVDIYVWSADRDGGVEGDDEMTNVLNPFKKNRIVIL